MSNSAACPDESRNCVDPLPLSCSFKGCDALTLHDESYDVTVEGDAGEPSLRDSVTTLTCEDKEDFERTFIWTDENDDFLSNTESEIYAFARNQNWKDQYYEEFSEISVQCTKDRVWNVTDSQLRYEVFF